MAMKSITLITVLVVVLAATQAEATLFPLPPLLPLPLIPVFNITGNVSCSVNGTIVVNGTNPAPPFRNALVQLSCGGIVRGLAITNQGGRFTIITSGLLNSLSNLLSSCRLVVVTPLSRCNATLPSTGTLQSALQVISSTPVGLLNVTILSPVGFIRVGV